MGTVYAITDECDGCHEYYLQVLHITFFSENIRRSPWFFREIPASNVWMLYGLNIPGCRWHGASELCASENREILIYGNATQPLDFL